LAPDEVNRKSRVLSFHAANLFAPLSVCENECCARAKRRASYSWSTMWP
jgi:hypothetical protein